MWSDDRHEHFVWSDDRPVSIVCGQMTGVSNGQWKLLLEARTHMAHFSPESDLSDMGYIDIDARSVPPHSILDSVGRC